ncbi:UNVERIFIED_ORG: hypothetical protein L601_004500000150 [Gordonia westfalica J30]
MSSIDYGQRAVAYWAKSELAYAEGDPQLGDELAEAAVQCEDWAREDRTGVYSDVA